MVTIHAHNAIILEAERIGLEFNGKSEMLGKTFLCFTGRSNPTTFLVDPGEGTVGLMACAKRSGALRSKK